MAVVALGAGRRGACPVRRPRGAAESSSTTSSWSATTRTSETTIRRELPCGRASPRGRGGRREPAPAGGARPVPPRHHLRARSTAPKTCATSSITVEEAPATTIGYGGGVEFQKVENAEFAPRGFIEIGRRNLWGKNRSVNLFSRVSLRRRERTETAPTGRPVDAQTRPRVPRHRRRTGSRGSSARAGTCRWRSVFEQGSRTSFRLPARSRARVNFDAAVRRALELHRPVRS